MVFNSNMPSWLLVKSPKQIVLSCNTFVSFQSIISNGHFVAVLPGGGWKVG